MSFHVNFGEGTILGLFLDSGLVESLFQELVPGIPRLHKGQSENYLDLQDVPKIMDPILPILSIGPISLNRKYRQCRVHHFGAILPTRSVLGILGHSMLGILEVQVYPKDLRKLVFCVEKTYIRASGYHACLNNNVA